MRQKRNKLFVKMRMKSLGSETAPTTHTFNVYFVVSSNTNKVQVAVLLTLTHLPGLHVHRTRVERGRTHEIWFM